MFLKYSSVYRHPPSLLGGFHGADFPPFCRYYEDAKTAFALLIVFGFPRLRYHLRGCLFLCAVSAATPCRLCLDLDHPVVRYREGYAWRREAIPGSRENLLYICPVLRPRPECFTSPLTVLHYCSRSSEYENSSVYQISRLNHTAFVLPVYASCRHLC